MNGCLSEGSAVAIQPCVKSVVAVCGVGAGEAVDGYLDIAADLGFTTLYQPLYEQVLGLLEQM